jgi:ABC-type Na+ transport system ATPase subunit NatA
MFSSHALEDVRDLADQVLVLELGEVRYSGPIEGWKR